MKSKLTKFAQVAGISLALVFTFSTTLAINVAYGAEAKAISIVKEGRFKGCPLGTVEELVNASMEKPKWSHSVGKNGVDYVTVKGLVIIAKPMDGVLQVWVKNDGFGIQSLELDKNPKTDLEVALFVNQACDATRKAKIKAQEAEDAKKKEELSKVRAIPAEPINDTRDGKKYKTVKIGSQTWMAENLNIKTGKSVCYSNKEDNCKKYGRLYDWATAMGIDPKYNKEKWGGSNVKLQGICPAGWHLPTKEELDKLTEVAGGKNLAGKYLKATSSWENYDGNTANGEDKFGFSALPGGNADYEGEDEGKDFFGFWNLDSDGNWWSASESSIYGAVEWSMKYDREGVNWYDPYKSKLFSIRCVKD